jgi:hypothetical protein
MDTMLFGMGLGAILTLIARPLVKILWAKVVAKTENVKL